MTRRCVVLHSDIRSALCSLLWPKGSRVVRCWPPGLGLGSSWRWPSFFLIQLEIIGLAPWNVFKSLIKAVIFKTLWPWSQTLDHQVILVMLLLLAAVALILVLRLLALLACLSTVWVKKIPPYGFLKFFPKRLGIFNQFFTHLLCDDFYTRIQIFIQLSPTLTKLCHTKHDHLANFYISLEL